MSSWPPQLPNWEISELQRLALGGDLSGVNPVAIGVIDVAESSGSGGGINPQGYGGWFGLGESSTYPGGTTTPALLKGTDAASFDTQAEIAASSFAQDLGRTGGDPVAAEEIYQTGHVTSTPGEGGSLMAEYLGTGTQPATTAPPSTASTGTTTATDVAKVSGPSAWVADLGKVLTTIATDIKNWAFIGAFAVVGAGMVVYGLRESVQHTAEAPS
ncbi:MAG: hypothetical protein ACRDOE_00180 [Streptosporangiaceae bacterium]